MAIVSGKFDELYNVQRLTSNTVADRVRERFQHWLAEQASRGRTFSDEQIRWLGMMGDPHVLAAEIAEDLRSALEQIESVLGDLQQRAVLVDRKP